MICKKNKEDAECVPAIAMGPLSILAAVTVAGQSKQQMADDETVAAVAAPLRIGG